MPQKGPLWENYEDAEFAILMDAVAEQEGQKGLQLLEELEKDPSAQVPEEVQRKAEKTIRKAFSMKKWSKVLRRIVIVVLVAVALAAGIFTAFPEVRADVLNMIARVYENFTDTSFSLTNSDEYPAAAFDVQLGWIPEGFVMTQDDTQYSSTLKLYQREDGATLSVLANTAEDRTIYVDTEDAQVTSIKIQGYDATLVEKDSVQWMCILFLVTEKNMMICLDTECVPVDQTIKVAENLRIN